MEFDENPDHAAIRDAVAQIAAPYGGAYYTKHAERHVVQLRHEFFLDVDGAVRVRQQQGRTHCADERENQGQDAALRRVSADPQFENGKSNT